MDIQHPQRVEQTQRTSLWRLTDGQRVRYGAAILALTLTNACLFGVPLIGKYAIDVLDSGDLSAAPLFLQALLDGNSSDGLIPYLWLSAWLSVLVTALAGCFQFLRGRWTAHASESIAESLRQSLYRRIHHVSARFFDVSDTGDLVQRCSSDVETLREFLASHAVEIGRAVILLITVLPILLWINVPLALLSLGLMPLLIAGAYQFFKRVRSLFLEADEAEGRMTSALQENLTGVRVVRAFNRQAFEIDKFAQCNKAFRNCNERLATLMSYYWSLSDFVSITQVGVVLIGGAHFVAIGWMTIGDLFAFITYVGMVIWPIRHLGRVLVDAGKAVVALDRVNYILEQPVEPPGKVPALTRAAGCICIRDLCFDYRSAEQLLATDTDAQQPAVLNGVSIDIAAGETLGIVGVPGSGKTSLIRVLLKLYDYQSGSVAIDGMELRDLDKQWLREQIAVVFQEPFLYSRSISGNLMVGDPQATPDALWSACETAAVHHAIEQFPDGYDAMVGERGVTLSGGQRQRLALSRALLKDPPILILDDSLSAVDTDTEQRILGALEAYRGRRTTLIIAHRLSSIRNADRIMVLDEGRICQLGTHDELAAMPGQYRRLCEIQGEIDASIQADLDELINV